MRVLDCDVTHGIYSCSLRKEYDKLRETLTLQNQEHQHAMGMLQQSHEERISKIREQYVDFTASLLKNTGGSSSSSSSSTSAGSGGGGAGGGGAGGGALLGSSSSGNTSAPTATKTK